MFKRSIVFLYGVGCYAVFLGAFLYAIGFVTNLYVPRSLDAPRAGDFVSSLIVDLALMIGFARRLGSMARQGFDQGLMRFIPEAAQRSTCVLAAGFAMIVLFVLWRPLGGTVWSVQETAIVAALHGLCACGWLMVLASTFRVNHFDLFGLRQAWSYLNSTAIESGTPSLDRLLRHRLHAGWLFAFWATPTMTAAHLLLAVGATVFVLVVRRLEARDLAFARPNEDDRAGVADGQAGRCRA